MQYSFSIKRAVLFIIILRSMHLLIHFAPPGHDITLLGMMARIYIETWSEGSLLPSTWEPVLGDKNFWEFHSLLAPIVAIICYILPINIIIILKIVNFIAFSLYDFSILILILTFFKYKKNEIPLNLFIAFISICYLSPFPSRFLGSGGGVYIFSSSLAILSVSYLIKIYQLSSSALSHYIAIIFLLLVSLLIHPMPAFHFLAFSPFIIWAYLINQQHTITLKHVMIYLKTTIYFFIICSPIILTFTRPTDTYHDSIFEWINHIKFSYSSRYFWDSDLPIHIKEVISFVAFLFKQFFPHIFIAAAFIFLDKRTIRTNKMFYFIFLLSTFLTWFGSYLPLIGISLYPDRLIQYCYIIFGIIIALTLDQHKWSQSMSGKLIVTFVILGSISRFSWSYLIQANSKVLLTKSDMIVIDKIKPLVGKDDLINTTYMDAGAWIPTLIGRKVSNPHVHISFEKDWENYKNKLKTKNSFNFAGHNCTLNPKCINKCINSQNTILIKSKNSIFCRSSS